MTEPSKGWLHRHTTRLPLQRLRMLTTAQAKVKGNKKEKEVSKSHCDSPLQSRIILVEKLGAVCCMPHALWLRVVLHVAGPYKDTVNLPISKFNMRANSSQREPELQKFWEKNKVYEELLKTNPGVCKLSHGLMQCCVQMTHEVLTWPSAHKV